MTRHLNANGSLTHNQKDRANKLGVNHMDYRMVVLQELADYNAELVSKNTKTVKIDCANPCVIIGHGPDWEREALKLKGKERDFWIICADICAKPLIKLGIIPDYIVTFEESPKVVKDELFPYDEIKRHDIQVVGSKITRRWMEDSLAKIGKKLHRFTDYPESYCSNVGLLGMFFAKGELMADKIILIGMNCWEDDIDFSKINWEIPRLRSPFLDWYTHFRQFFRENRGMIVNCSQGGLLYTDGAVMADLANLEIKNA